MQRLRESAAEKAAADKICTKCGCTKPLEDFGPDKRHKDGKQSHCRECCSKREYSRRAGSIDAYQEYRRNGIKEHRIVDGVEKKHCYKCNKWKPVDDYQKKRSRIDGLYPLCRRCAKERARIYHMNNYEKTRAYSIQWANKNRERLRKRLRESSKRIRSTKDGRLRHGIAVHIRGSIKYGGKAGRAWESLVGYTLKDLKAHLEKLFSPGMSWDNHGEWHIDHIIPQSAFNFNTPDDIDFKRCWALNNLRPMWAMDNMRKNKKLYKPFQPSLAIAV